MMMTNLIENLIHNKHNNKLEFWKKIFASFALKISASSIPLPFIKAYFVAVLNIKFYKNSRRQVTLSSAEKWGHRLY